MCWARPARGALCRHSSAERVQVKLTAADPERYRVACNRRPVPLAQVGNGQSVAGVRYKAWKPPLSLHPVLPTNVPSCSTFLTHGRVERSAVAPITSRIRVAGYDTFPVNGNEAEARRLARFEGHGHSAGMYELGRESTHPGFPFTFLGPSTVSGIGRT